MNHERWIFCAVITMLCLILAQLPNLAQQLIWQREQFEQGQWWLALSAHFTHLDSWHLLFNLLGLFLVCELFWDQLLISEACIVLLVSALGVAMLLWLWQPTILWYAGLSGVLHGLWAGFAGAGWLRRRTVFFLLALLALVCKLLWMPVVASSVPVVQVAHGYGAGAGLFALLLIRIKRSGQLMQQKPELD